MLVFAHCNFDVLEMMFCWCKMCVVLGVAFFCWVELFLSVPEGGIDEMQFKNILACKILCKYIFNRCKTRSFYLDFVNILVYDVYQLLL